MLFYTLSLAQLVRGNRGEVLSQIVVATWVLYYIRGKSINIIKIVAFGMLMIILSEFISFWRAGVNASLAEEIGPVQQIKWFLYTQGVSGQLVAIAVDYSIGDDPFRYIIFPLFFFLKG